MYIKILKKKKPQRHVKSCHKAARDAARLLRINTVLAHRFSSCFFLGPAVLPSATPGKQLKLQILRPHSRPTESDTLGWALFVPCLLGGSAIHSSWRTTVK